MLSRTPVFCYHHGCHHAHTFSPKPTGSRSRTIPFEVAILPWGATEPHNFHLPYATDNYETASIAERAAEIAWKQGAKVVVLPTVPFGVNTGQLNLRLALNMNPSTQFAVLSDIAAALSSQGVRKLLVLNGHGGNDFKQMIRELQPRGEGLFVCYDQPGERA